MKKNDVLATITLICMFFTGVFHPCNVNGAQNLQLRPSTTKGNPEGDSCLAKENSALRIYWESQLKKSPKIKKAMQQLITDDETFLWNYIKSSHSGWIGNYYAIPIAHKDTREINCCAIIPVKPYNKGEYGLHGRLKKPIIMNSEKLNSIPQLYRYLFSLLFLKWKEKGLNVEPSLTEIALKYRNKVVPLDNNPSK